MEDERIKIWLWLNSVHEKQKEIAESSVLEIAGHEFKILPNDPNRIQVRNCIDRIAELFEKDVKKKVLRFEPNSVICSIKIGEIEIAECQINNAIDEGYQE